MTRPKVLVTSNEVPAQAIQLLKDNCDVDIYDGEIPIPKEVLTKRISGVDGLFCLLTDPVDASVIQAAGEQLKVVATMSVGFDHIDVEECKKRSIGVSNTPEVSTDSVAELTVSLLLAVGRRLFEASTAIKNGEWSCPWRPVWLCGQGVHGSVVGIVGMGRIGRAIMKRILPFGVQKVLYYDVFHPVKAAEEEGAVFAEFDDLLRQSDFVVCMCNLSDQTKEMFNARAFSLMKSTAIFINTARGGLVHQEDLYNALKAGTIRAAGLDVMLPEPLPKDHPLTTLPNIMITAYHKEAKKVAKGLVEDADKIAEKVGAELTVSSLVARQKHRSNPPFRVLEVLTPHIGSAEINVRNDMALLAANNILAVLGGKPLISPVY